MIVILILSQGAFLQGGLAEWLFDANREGLSSAQLVMKRISKHAQF